MKCEENKLGDKLNIVLIGALITLAFMAIYCRANTHFEIICLPEKNELSRDYGVRIKEIYLDDQWVDLNKIELTKGWSITEDGMLAGYANESISLPIDLKDKCNIKVVYLKQNCLGKMRFKLNEQSIEVDSYEDTEWKLDEIQISLKQFNYGTYIFLLVVFETVYLVWRSFGKK